MSTPGLDHNTATDDEIVAFCSSPGREILGGAPWGNRVIKISREAVVKFGVGVREEEANNQRIACKLVDHNIVRVPRVYHFFTRGLVGYIVMEYIRGHIMEQTEQDTGHLVHIDRIARILNHLATISRDTPGPLGGGVCLGLLWPENEDLSFNTLDAIEDFFNSRLRSTEPKLMIRGYKSVVCHLDVAPRNILWLEDGSVCLLDWASAGFYPRFFEFCMQWINLDKDGQFNRLLIEAMGKLTDEEEEQGWRLIRAWNNSQRYYFPPQTASSQTTVVIRPNRDRANCSL